MDRERLDETFRDGTAKQWDPQVVEAFFAARDDIDAIAQEAHHEDETDPDLPDWT